MSDPRAVMTLDAGGTNFVFSAMRANQTVVPPFTLPANADNLERSLGNITEGFRRVKEQLPACWKRPAAPSDSAIFWASPWAPDSAAGWCAMAS